MATSKKTSTKTPAPVMRKTGAVQVAMAKNYLALLAEVKARIQSAQYTALRAVNKELVGLYWDIGRLIVARQQTEGWGKGVVEQLSTDLRVAFPGAGGFSTQNLWYMRQFFQEYSVAPKLQPLVGEIGWSHNLLILSRCKDAQEREFYLRMTRKFGWSKNVLVHQIDNQSYEKSLLGQTNFDQPLTPALRAQARLAVKDEYAFDFLELGGQHSECELERALIARIEDFLRAMGGMFAFMGSQYRLEVEGKEYFLDLLLFHRRLRALVAIELKIGEFEPEFVGKMHSILLRWMSRCGRRTKIRPSASSCARRRRAPSSSMRCAMRASPSAWRPTKSPGCCRRSSRISCHRPKPSPACWRVYENDRRQWKGTEILCN